MTTGIRQVVRNGKRSCLGAVLLLLMLTVTGCGGTAESWAYDYEPTVEILNLGGNGKAVYKGEKYSKYVKDDAIDLTEVGITAEDIKIKIGSAYPYEGEGTMNIKGRNLMDGLPKNVDITSEEIREAMAEPISQIADLVKTTLEKTPPELASDIIDRGIMLTGGGALIKGLDRLIAEETKIPVIVASRPLDCVVNGTGICLEGKVMPGREEGKKYI